MSKLNIKKLQLGASATPSQNFHIEVPDTPDGTMRFARGNVGAALNDIITVDASGNVILKKPGGVDANLSLFTDVDFGVGGRQRLPGGLILQWGGTGNINSGANAVITFPIAFPTAVLRVLTTFASSSDIAAGGAYVGQVRATSAANVTIRNLGPAAASFEYIAIGY